MKPSALEQSNARLVRAKAAYKALADSEYFDEAEPAWSDFLLAINTIYSKLEQGAKGCSKSEYWFGKLKNQRKKDDLLRYLHFARNADEHGLQSVTEQGAQNFDLDGRQLKFGEVVKLTIVDVVSDTYDKSRLPQNASILGPQLVLVRARDDRYNDYCDPPHHHNGVKLDYIHPAAIAELALVYFDGVLSEATSKLPEH